MRRDVIRRTMMAAACMLAAGCVQAQSGSWTIEAPPPTPDPNDAHVAATAVEGGLLYLFGGNGANHNNLSYEPASDAWNTTLAAMPTGRGGPSAQAVEGSIYVFGGSSGSTVFGTVEIYDPDQDSWSVGASMNTPLSQGGAAVVDGIIYAIGGWNNSDCSQYCNRVQAYDPAVDTWTDKASMPTARRQLCVATVDGLIYAIGGWGGSQRAEVEIYDPGTDAWQSGTPMPTPRTGPSCGVLNGKIVVVSGDGPGNGFSHAVEIYDPITDTWSDGADAPTAGVNSSAETLGTALHVVNSQDGVPYHESFELGGVEVAFDVKPEGCPNPLNANARGLLPAAITGTADVDVADLDAASIRLEGVESKRSDVEDVASPFDPRTGKAGAGDCTASGPDGFEDLTLKFPNRDVVDALEARLDRELVDGEILVVKVTGRLLDGTDFAGEDVVEIIKKK